MPTDRTIESLPTEEREAADYHVEWVTRELGDREAAEEFVSKVLIKLGPQRSTCRKRETEN